MIHMMKKVFCLLFCLLLLLSGTALGESVTRMHFVYNNWVGEYTGQVDSNNIPFGFGLFLFPGTEKEDAWHYIGQWENGVPEGEGAVYLDSGNMEKGIFSKGELIKGLRYTANRLEAVSVEKETTTPETEVLYIGNKKSMRFHLPTCRSVSQMKESNKVEFYSREEAIERNYIPCGDCNP